MIACPDCGEHLKNKDRLEAELAAEKEAKETLAQLRENLAGRLTAALSRVASLERQLAESHGDLCENGHVTHEECTDACSCVGSGKSRLEVAEAERPLVTFARDVIDEFFHDGTCGDIDGGWLQDRLIDLKLVAHPAAPVEGCNCCEEDPGECWHPVPIALRAVEGGKL
jgi:hypothetical protein